MRQLNIILKEQKKKLLFQFTIKMRCSNGMFSSTFFEVLAALADTE